MSPKVNSVEKASKKTGCHGNRPLRDRKTILIIDRLQLYSSTTTNPANLTKIGLLDVDIIGLKGIVKNKKKAKHIARR